MEMSSRTAGRIAWGLVAFALISSIVGEGIVAAAGRTPDWFAFMVLMFPVVGALIVSRRPRNAVGWVMLGIGALILVAEVLTAYVAIGLDLRPGSLPAPGAALALETAMWVPVIGLMGTFLILLFPDGHLPTARWRWWAWFCALAMVFSYLAIIIQPYEFLEEGYPEVSNPFGIEAISESISGALLVVLISIPIAVVGCVVALIRRFRHSQGRTRLQLKWLVAAAATVGAVYGLNMFASLPFAVLGRDTPAWIEATNNISILPFFFLPVAIGIAILRHRLYDIDLIINRALVYGVLTVMLTITYVVVIAVLQVVARPSRESPGSP
jgi:putative effector of murein hydrolase LrgA (UPF0299 family)